MVLVIAHETDLRVFADLNSSYIFTSLGDDIEHVSMKPISLLPRSNALFYYEGSLTTPPCSEVVTWIVFRDPISLSKQTVSIDYISNSYITVCPPVRGDNPRALASGLSPVHADKPWYNYFIPPSSV